MREFVTFLFLLLLVTPGLAQDEPEQAASPTPSATPIKPVVEPAPTPSASPAPQTETPEIWRIGVAGSEPFVVHEGQSLQGLSVEVWEALAQELGVKFELIPAASVSDVLQGVQDGTYDVGVGALSITSERATFVDFTQPYYDSSLGILTHARPPEKRATLQADFYGFAMAVGTMLVALTIVGTIFWLLERHSNSEQFPETVAHGVGNGMWMALVTATTVGYGDRAPITPLGRILTGIWMLVTTVTLSSFTAWLATTLTVQKLEENILNDASQLHGKRVAVVSGTTSEVFARHFTNQLLHVENYATGIEKLDKGAVDALVYDYPVLRYYLAKNSDLPMRLAESTFALQDYGFCVKRGNPSLSRLNVGLLRLLESGVIRDISEHWLSRREASIP